MLKTIPIKEVKEPAQVQADLIKAVLTEIDEALTQLYLHQQEHTIDLRGIFRADQTSALKNLLGKGEVSIKLDIRSPTDIEETAIGGVWWLTHYNEAMEKHCEFIGIAFVPQLINCTEVDIQLGQQKLKTIKNQLN